MRRCCACKQYKIINLQRSLKQLCKRQW
jgi:hypothetical protein